MPKFTARLFIAIALCVSFTANAARPSFTSLQQQINQLQSQVTQLANQTMVIKDGNGVTFGKVISLEGTWTAYVIYQWQGYDLRLEVNTEGASAGRRADLYHTKADCSDEPWSEAFYFDRNDEVTITGDTYESVVEIWGLNSNTFKIIGLTNPSQTPATIVVEALSHPDDPVCYPFGPYQMNDMVQGIVELTPEFGADHPPPYTVVVE